MANSPDEPVVKPAVEARQGESGRDVSYVLFISLGSVVVLLAIAYFYFFG
jgi:hypothetical protein